MITSRALPRGLKAWRWGKRTWRKKHFTAAVNADGVSHADSEVPRSVASVLPAIPSFAHYVEHLPRVRHQPFSAFQGRRLRTARTPRSGHQVHSRSL
ncbi:hypothetical protein B296_00041979 [Ensete ventricosum]|uniref:Uncharacterized protein n=1 Tax=Ensete ventricosum TaxID=4639 RepID=A0A426ZJW6_ENSVE|nr:hypothetical protein B296_00041979 [Ensete ventricosum]